jgi:hypothetical protein
LRFNFPFYRSPLLQLFSPFETLIVGCLTSPGNPISRRRTSSKTQFDSADGKALVENDRQRTPARAIEGAYQSGGAI